ncbi:MAG: hypothetical protein J6L81_10885 [Clostridia bacterium]|nr:hypothetical protein [Clostridia bacterium]
MSPKNKKEGFLSKLSDKNLNLIVIAAIAVVIIATIVCVFVQMQDPQASASGSASASASADAAPTSDEIDIDPTSTSASAATVPAGPIADGSYTCASTGAIIAVNNSSASYFDFILTLADGASFSGEAAFSDSATSAIYTSGSTSIRFTAGSGSVTVGLSGSTAALGLPGGSVIDGVYSSGAQQTTTTTTATTTSTSATTAATTTANSSAPNNALDVGFKDQPAMQTALKTLMGDADYNLMNSIFSTGSQQISSRYPDVTYDKNNVMCRTDVDLNAVKYEYVTNNGSGERIILLCTQDGKAYVGICDGSEFRYYTNDPAYKTKAPECISETAKGLGFSLSYK